MNTRSSSWTGRAPRTLEQSFGPYTSNDLHPMPESKLEAGAGFALAVVIGCVLAMLAFHWLAL